jgi:GNAT superfamily N-acetyltransferase
LALKIVPVRTKSERDAFISAPFSLYRNDPNWVPPLLFDRRAQIDPKHPFFRHADMQAFVAYDGAAVVGRISAQIDHLNDDRGRTGLGYFGSIDAIDDRDVFAALFADAEGWLKARGMTRVVGPLNLNINQEVGLLVDGFDTPPYFMMGHSFPYVGQRIEDTGYHAVKDLLAYEMDPAFKIPPVMEAVARRLAGRMVVRPIDRKDRDRDLRAMCGIFNDAWEHNWGFVPFTEEEFLTIGHEMLLIISDDFIQIAEVDGEPAAFIVMLPNVNEAIADLNGRLLPFGWLKLLWRLKVRYPHSARVPLMGVRQAYQRTRLGPGLAFAVIHAVRNASVARGIRRIEMSWILENNAGMRNIIETIGGRVSKRYRLYEKSLDT